MKDISLHIMDIVENSVKAGAKTVTLEFTWKGTRLGLLIEDDGPGFPESIRDNPADPFKTTRKERKVGLGLPLLKDTAEQCEGWLKIGSSTTGGVKLETEFNMAHIDSKPLGDIEDMIVTFITIWPQMNWVIKLNPGGEVLNTAALREELGDLDMSNRQIRDFFLKELMDEFKPLEDWIAGITPGF